MATYIPRIADHLLADTLRAMGATLLEGPRGCGKTETARQSSAHEVLLDIDAEARRQIEIDPLAYLRSTPDAPFLIDEWQRQPQLWDAVRRVVDERGLAGQFILTGSAAAQDATLRHPGAARIATVRMRTMSLFEQGHSTGQVSLEALLDGDTFVASLRSALSLDDYVRRIVIGGWPQLVGEEEGAARIFVPAYLDNIIHHDLELATGSSRDPRRLRRFLHAYAQVTSHPAPLSTIVARAHDLDDATDDGADVVSPNRLTSSVYAEMLRRMWVLDEVDAWNIDVRSRARLATSPKRHLADPSLSASLLAMGSTRLRRDLETLGFLFESLVTRDVRIYAGSSRASLYHYRERGGELEVDLIVERDDDGEWIGIECKLGSTQIDQAAANLIQLRDSRVRRPPRALAVVTATDAGYRRADGVLVVPLGLLGP